MRIQGGNAFPDIFACDSAGLEEGQAFLAKNSDHLADLQAEDTGGLFSSLLADEDDFDRRRTLWRVACWSVISVAAVVGAMLANQSSLGWRREQAMTADLVQQANRLQAVARDSQNEARRLASAVETLNSDRDRLYTRVTVLEQGLDSVTGAIARQNAAAATPPQPEVQPAAQPAPAIGPIASKPASPSPAPAVAAAASKPSTPSPTAVTVASKPAAPPVAPAVEPVASKPAKQSEKASAAASAEPAPASTAAVKDVPTKPAAKPAAMPATPLVESKSIMAPPDPAAGKLIEPSKPASGIAAGPIPVVAAASPFTDGAEQEAAEPALPKIQRTEFGVDVGGANSIAGLRALWRGLLKSRSNAALAALQPVIVIHEGSGGRGMHLRLVAGPFTDAAEAAKLCAALNARDKDCETAVYEGQRLALKAEDAPAGPAKSEATQPARRKNTSQKRAAVEEPARKPEPAAASGWSSFFGKKN
jgi:hypothetical protein